MHTQIIGNGSTNIKDIVNIARHGAKVSLSEDCIPRINASRKIVENCVEQSLVRYGITTGFGKFCDISIDKKSNSILQKNLIMSHAVGVGSPLEIEIVRAMMALRANALCIGNSGARLSTIQAIIDMLNSGITPFVPEKGSLGASGDLVPLSHMAIALCGMGKSFYNGELLDTSFAMKKAGIKPIELSAKEGLALINGTQCMTALAVLAVQDALDMLASANKISAMTMQALCGISDAFDPRIHQARGQSGQIDVAQDMLAILEGSELITRQGEARVQDAYVLRCIPQIHGASLDAFRHCKTIVQREINAVTDNPLIFPNPNDPSGGDILSGGNFHGQPIALPMDYLAIASSELGNVSERRLERMVNPSLSNGLPAFLVKDGGLNSGFMIVQYTAASLVSENKVLSHPASVDSIPSSANQEDHVSMGTIAARKARQIIEHSQTILALELLAASQAIDLKEASKKLSPASQSLYKLVRQSIPMLKEDRLMQDDIAEAIRLVKNGLCN